MSGLSCIAVLSAFFYISRSARLIGKTITWSVWQNTPQTVCCARMRLVPYSTRPRQFYQFYVAYGRNFYSCNWTTIQWSTFFPVDPREVLRRKPFIPIFGTKGRCFQCWRNVFLTDALNQRTKSDWTEFMSVEICIEQAVTGYASLIKLMLFLVSIILQIE